MDTIITIVSGLPRTGTSMMMKVLQAGGMKIVADNIRKSDIDNPQGYYEYEMVKKIKEDTLWLEDAKGKVFKMVSMLLYDLPSNENYKVIFMKRKMSEVLASQRKMLERMGQNTGSQSDEEMWELYNKHLDGIAKWIKEQSNIDVLYINYNDFIEDPSEQIEMVSRFLDYKLNTEEAVKVVDKALYRNRDCSF